MPAASAVTRKRSASHLPEKPTERLGLNQSNVCGQASCLALLKTKLRTFANSERKIVQAVLHLVEMADAKKIQAAADVADWYLSCAPHIKIFPAPQPSTRHKVQRSVSLRPTSTAAVKLETRNREIAPYLAVLDKMKSKASRSDQVIIETVAHLVKLTPTNQLQRAITEADLTVPFESKGNIPKVRSHQHKLAG